MRYVDDNLHTGVIAWAENFADIDRFTAAVEDHFNITEYRQKPIQHDVPQFEGGTMHWCRSSKVPDFITGFSI